MGRHDPIATVATEIGKDSMSKPIELRYDDQTHSYWIDGERARSVSNIAKIPDDTYSLDQWRKRMVAVGMAMSPDLVERVAAHYDDNSVVNGLAEQAMDRAGAKLAAGKGAAAHRITERIDLSSPIIDTEFSRRIRAAWQAALDAAELEIIPDYVERIICYPEAKIAGRFDRVVRHRRTRRLHILDLKTGESAVKYPHAMSVQLGVYANAPWLAGPLSRGIDGTTRDFEPWPPPELDTRTGYILHMTDTTACAYPINVNDGYQVFEHIVAPIIRWRKRRDLIGPAFVADLTPVAPVAEVEYGEYAEPLPLVTRECLIERLLSLTPEQRAEVAASWPGGVPTFKQTDRHTEAELMAIHGAMVRVAGDLAAPEVPPAPAEAVTEAPMNTGGTSVAEDDACDCGEAEAEASYERDQSEGTEATETPLDGLRIDATAQGWTNGAEPADDASLTEVREQYPALAEEPRRMVDAWTAQARNAGNPFGDLKSFPTIRRATLAKVAIALANVFDGDEDLVHAALLAVTGKPDGRGSRDVGAIVADLGAEEARGVLSVCFAYALDPSVCKFTDLGAPYFDARVALEEEH